MHSYRIEDTDQLTNTLLNNNVDNWKNEPKRFAMNELYSIESILYTYRFEAWFRCKIMMNWYDFKPPWPRELQRKNYNSFRGNGELGRGNLYAPSGLFLEYEAVLQNSTFGQESAGICRNPNDWTAGC